MANHSTGSEGLLFVGLDVHKETIAVAVAPGDGREPRFRGTIPNTPKALLQVLERIGPADRLRCCYEAGPTGYSTWRLISGWGIACTVVAPSLIPKKPGDRVKTDRRDAVQLARLHRMGDLTAVWVPSPEHEALRDLCRAREAAKRDRERARHRLLKFLVRHDIRPATPLKYGSKGYWIWVAELRLEDPTLHMLLDEYRGQFAEMGARLDRLTARVAAASEQGPCAAVLGALQCLKGVGPITAVTLVAELGDLTRFKRPRQLMGYSGLTPSEYSSGGHVKRGAITKCGNHHVRFVMVEWAWRARWDQRPISTALRQRREAHAPAIVQIAETAQRRGAKRYAQLCKRGKLPVEAVTALARELLGFVWAIGQAVAAAPAADETTPPRTLETAA